MSENTESVKMTLGTVTTQTHLIGGRHYCAYFFHPPVPGDDGKEERILISAIPFGWLEEIPDFYARWTKLMEEGMQHYARAAFEAVSGHDGAEPPEVRFEVDTRGGGRA